MNSLDGASDSHIWPAPETLVGSDAPFWHQRWQSFGPGCWHYRLY